MLDYTVTIVHFCAVISCGALSNPANGQLSLTGTTAGGMTAYTCSVGHNLNGISERVCQCSGQWSGEEPTCEGMCCVLRREEGRDGGRNGGRKGGKETREREEKSLSLLYAYVPPTTAVDCGSLADPDNGGVTFSGTAFQSQATYTCTTGYELTGMSTRTCQSDAQWSGSQPQCTSEYAYMCDACMSSCMTRQVGGKAERMH